MEIQGSSGKIQHFMLNYENVHNCLKRLDNYLSLDCTKLITYSDVENFKL